jgi:hypothetical protein
MTVSKARAADFREISLRVPDFDDHSKEAPRLVRAWFRDLKALAIGLAP